MLLMPRYLPKWHPLARFLLTIPLLSMLPEQAAGAAADQGGVETPFRAEYPHPEAPKVVQTLRIVVASRVPVLEGLEVEEDEREQADAAHEAEEAAQMAENESERTAATTITKSPTIQTPARISLPSLNPVPAAKSSTLNPLRRA